MKSFLNDFFGIDEHKKQELIYRAAPRFFMEIMRKYFRLQVEGIENVPKRGPVIIAPNHSGYAGFDAIMLAWEIHRQLGRTPRVLTHHLWFLNETTSIPANKLGFIEATIDNGMEQLKKNNAVVIFPEGEQGNFKPTSKAYELQEFRRGFVRMALKSGAPIVPVMIIGAEETHINLSQIRFTKFLRGTILPLPLNILPLPVKWRIKFLRPIYLPYKASAAKDPKLVREIADEIREQVQAAITKELKTRTSIF